MPLLVGFAVLLVVVFALCLLPVAIAWMVDREREAEAYEWDAEARRKFEVDQRLRALEGRQ
jgi:hypothetical protein